MARFQKRPDAPMPTACFACGEEVRGLYCYACGQKNDDCRRSIVRLCSESVGDFVAFDGRALRTLGSVIVRPGRHVRAYGDGKRSPYSPPVRFFLIISLVFFTMLALTGRQLIAFQPVFQETEGGQLQLSEVKPAFFVKNDVRILTDEQRGYIQQLVRSDRADDSESFKFNGQEFTSATLAERFMTVVENPRLFNANLNRWIPRLMIVLIPLMAVLGALFIRGSNALIYDHLLVALNTHAVMFLVLTISLLGSSYLPFVPGSLYEILILGGIPLYYTLTVKGAFGRGWIKTVLSSFFVLLLYGLAFMVGMTLVTGKSIIDVL
ncbi:MAG: DUF3667 domain-containing protein [Parvularcula sp.]